MIYDFDNLTFNILTIKKVCHPDGFFHVNGRPFSAFVFRTNGNSEFDINSKSFSVKEGDVSFMPGNLSYNVNYSNCEFIVVHFTECNYNSFENISNNIPAVSAMTRTARNAIKISINYSSY